MITNKIFSLKAINNIARVLAGVSLLYFIISFTGDGSIKDNLLAISNIYVFDWILLLFISAFSLILLSSMFRIAIEVVAKKISYKHAFLYTAMNNFFNTVLPLKGGVLIRGIYLKKIHGVNLLDYFSVSITTQLFNLLFLTMVAFLVFPRAFLAIFEWVNVETLYLLALGLVTCIFLVGIYKKLKVKLFQLSYILLSGLKQWFKSDRSLTRYFIVMMIFHLVSAFRFWYSFELVNAELSFTFVIGLYCLITAGLFIAFTPGNIGVREVGIVLLSSLIGIHPEIALSAALIDRFSGLLTSLFIGGFATVYISKSQQEIVAP